MPSLRVDVDPATARRPHLSALQVGPLGYSKAQGHLMVIYLTVVIVLLLCAMVWIQNQHE